MLISHRYKFIFLRTEKAASTSLFTVFKDIAGQDGLLYPADRNVRRRLLRKHGSLEGFSFVGRTGATRKRLPWLSGLHFHAHAGDVRDFIGPELFERYTVISSERNPWDRQVSLFNQRIGKHGRNDLESFNASMLSPVYNFFHHNRLRNWNVYTINDRIAVDHMIRYETLEQDFHSVLRTLGLDPDQHALPHKRNSGRPRNASYRALYTDRTRDLVARWYRREIAHFGYEF